MGPAVYAPVPERSNQLLYYRSDFAQTGIFHITEGSEDGGTVLATPNWDEYIQYGQAWLPDGSGFLYAVRSMFGGSKLFHYSFAANSTTLIAEFADHVGAPSVSPDGQQIVFERGPSSDLVTGIITDPDLWIINRDGSGLHLLVENGRLPVWSLQNPTTPPSTPSTPTPEPEGTPTPTPTATLVVPLTPSPTRTDQPAVYLPTILR
jgi:Tol biopolymer transport system component